MAANDSEKKGYRVVISGIAGRFPKSNSIEELRQNLLNKIDCTTTDHGRWEYDSPKIPNCIGKCNNIGKFDRVFFGVHARLTGLMDPLSRLILEHSFEAVIDAGINPKSLRGANIAVYTATNISESEKTVFNRKVQKDGFGIMGGSKAMVPNRVSFFLGLTGSSVNLDSGCTGSASALERAYRDIKNGHCEGAIVAGCILCIHAHLSYQLKMLGQLSPDGKTRSFDDLADGHTRSDSIAVLFLQRAENAKRIYQEVIHIKQVYSSGEEIKSIMYPTVESQVQVMKDALKESGLTPDDVSFMEASGIGIKAKDAEELRAIDAVYGERKEPLLVGSVMSNIGNAVPANTVNSIIKIIIASESGMIPPNLHYETPNSEALCLAEGRVQIPTELIPWTGPYSAVNTIANGGVVSGVILKAPNNEKKNNGIPNDKLQRLVIVSGRTEQAVTTLLDFMETRQLDVEFLQMLYDVFESNIDGYLYRGCTVIPANGVLPEGSKKSEILFNNGEKREVWWIFSGMGSQWTGMGEALLKLPMFEASIRKCDNVLKPLGYDIYQIITDKSHQTFDRVINSFIGIAAVQIGLVDVLKAVGLEPDYVIGHSVGELGCAYADGCLTAEQMILAALSRGLASTESELIEGSMAAVGLGYEDIKPLCPPDIDVACHNGPDSSTISGPAQSMKEFVATLTAKGIFAREVPCSRIAYHSRYIAPAGSKLLDSLQKVIPKPNPRSAKWVSTSVPRDEWNTLKARLCSAEYHTNNLLNPVLFDESSRLIPKNAICVEIAPHGLLQAILNRSLHKTCINIPLTKRGHPDNLEYLLTALGKLYNAGLQPQVSNLYPKVQYPVGRGTPSLSSLIRWDHTADWPVNYFKAMGRANEGEQTIEIDLNEEAFSYLRGNVINGKIAVPLSLYLVKTWEVLKSFQAEPILSVVFENIKIHQLILDVPDDEKISLTFIITQGTGTFEVVQSKNFVLSGTIKTTLTPDRERINLLQLKEETRQNYELGEDDFYTEMEMRGYKYTGQFRTVLNSSIEGTKALLKWSDDWVTYIDGALQFYTFRRDFRQIEMPLSIRKIVIDGNLHESVVKTSNDVDVFLDERLNCLSAGGLEIQGVKLSVIPKSLEQNQLSADTSIIVPNVHDSGMSIAISLRFILQLVFENIFTSKTPVIQIVKHHNLGHIQSDAMNNIPEASLFKIEYDICYEDATFNKALTVLQDDITNYDITEISRKLGNGKFILTFINSTQQKPFIKLMESNGLKTVFMRKLNNEYVALLKKEQTISKHHTIDISQNITNSINQIDNIKDLLQHERVVLVLRSGADIDVNDLIDRLENRHNLGNIRIFDLRNSNIANHSLDKLLEEQMELDIFVNILTSENAWATLRRTAIPLKAKLCKSWRANQKYLHDPATYTWTEGPVVPSNMTTIKVEYSTLNTQDLLIANGTFYANSSKLIGKNRIEPISIGLEFSGTDCNGNRVMGITQGNAMSNYVYADEDWTWHVPQAWSLEDAATVPLPYVVAYSACYIKANIQPGKKVVIVNPCTEFGLAILNLTLHHKGDLFITYQNEEERNFLLSFVPNVQDVKLIKLAADSFREEILNATNGRGVDAVICNKCEIKEIELYLTTLELEGRVILISDFSNNMIHDSIGMQIFLIEAGFSSVIPERLLLSDSKTKKLIANMFNDGIEAGHVRPLPKIVYDRNSLNEALSACKENKHKAKIVVKIQPEESSTNEALAIPRLYCSESNCYIIFEGLTHFGIELTDWLITRGARKFIITSTSKLDNGYAKLRMKYWNDYGIHITMYEQFNYSNKKLIKEIFEEARSIGQLDGVFDLRHMNTANESINFSSSFDAATLAIDEESRTFSAQLRLFVACSSVNNAAIEVTESIYSCAQLVEKVLSKRKEDGLPGLLIKWKLSDAVKGNPNAASTDAVSLAISKYIQKLDEILGTDEIITEVTYLTRANKEIEGDAAENDIIALDSAWEDCESFKAGLYKAHIVNADFYSLELEL